MTSTRAGFRCGLCLLAGVAVVSASAAQNCGVATVSREAARVQVQFTADHRIEPGRGTWQRDGRSRPQALRMEAGVASVDGQALHQLSLAPGGEISDSWEHASCRVAYASQNGVVGVRWRHEAALPGLPAVRSEGFIAAQPR